MEKSSIADFNSFKHQQFIDHSHLDQQLSEIIELLSANLSINVTQLKQEDFHNVLKSMSKIAKEANACHQGMVARLAEYSATVQPQ